MPTVFQNWGDPIQGLPTGRVLFYVPQERPSTLTAGKVVTTKVVEVPLVAGGFSVTLEPGALQYKVLIDGAPSYRGVLVVPDADGPHLFFDLREDFVEYEPPVVGAAQAAAASAAESAAVAVAAAVAAEAGAGGATDAGVAPLVVNAGATRDAVDDRVETVGDTRYVPLWQPNTAYLAGALAVSPTTGQTGTAKVDFTSGATYNPANWNLATGGGSGITITDNSDGTATITASGGTGSVTDNGDGTATIAA